MKTLILIIVLTTVWKIVICQNSEVLLLGKLEPDVLFSMKHDTSFTYDKQVFEDNQKHHVTYQAKNNSSLLNIYFVDNVATIEVYYYLTNDLPGVISSLNLHFKRTDTKTWIDKQYLYKIRLFDDDNSVSVAFTKL